MNKESWYKNCKSENIIRISEKEDWVVDYDKERGMYRVSYFQDNHFVDECWFDAYEEKEVDNRIEKIIDKFEEVKINFKEKILKDKKYLSAYGIEVLCNNFIKWIKNLE